MYWVLTKVLLLGSVINLLLSSHISKQAWKANTWGPKLWCTQQFTACHWPRNRMGKKRLGNSDFTPFFSLSVTPQTKKSEQSFPSRWHLKGPYLIFKDCTLGGCLHPCAHTPGRDRGLGTWCWWQRMLGCRQALLEPPVLPAGPSPSLNAGGSTASSKADGWLKEAFGDTGEC